MTCIAGVVHKEKVYIGGDSAGVGDWSLTVRADRKVFRNGDFLFGFTSSFRMGQLLRYAFKPPDLSSQVDVNRYLATSFIDGVRDCLKTGGFAEKDKEREAGGVFLLGYRGQLFRIGSDYQVGEAADGFDAVGSGDEVALGSLFSTVGKPPGRRIEIALKAAERINAAVRGPFHIESVA